VNSSFDGDIHRIQPFRPFEPDFILGEREEASPQLLHLWLKALRLPWRLAHIKVAIEGWPGNPMPLHLVDQRGAL
jgi:hypothetical protein